MPAILLLLLARPAGAADPAIDPPVLTVPERLAGSDRFETAAAIAAAAYPSGAGTVFLARADDPVDALAAGALTEGPVLLVPRCGSVPQVVDDAVSRLKPEHVVALGGRSAVCDPVLSHIAGSRPTARLAGDDRFDTSAAIARRAFPDGAEVVYVADGREGVDALAAGALTDGPVVLAAGEEPEAEVQQAVAELDPERVVALGGTAAVSEAVLMRLADGRETGRLAGADRVATAARIAEKAFPGGAPQAYLARADLAPDALVAGALQRGPILLTPGTGVLPEPARAELDRLDPVRVVALGGTAAVTDAVLAQAVGSSGCGAPYPRPGVALADDQRSPFTLVRSRPVGTPPLSSVASLGVSADGGRWVFSAVTANLEPEERTGRRDVYVQDGPEGTPQLVSRAGDGGDADGSSYAPRLSEDGRKVVFTSRATNLGPDDANGHEADLYVVTVGEREVRRLPVVEGGGGAADIDASGEHVAVTTDAALAPGDRPGLSDAYLVEVATGAATLVNDVDDGRHAQADAVSDDGAVVAWSATARPGGARTEQRPQELHVHDVTRGFERVVSRVGEDARRPALDADGSHVAYVDAGFDGSGAIVLADLGTGAYRVRGDGSDVALSATGDRTAVRAGEQVVLDGDAGDGARVLAVPLGDTILDADADLGRLVVSPFVDPPLVLDTSSGQLHEIRVRTDAGHTLASVVSTPTDDGRLFLGDRGVLVDALVPGSATPLPAAPDGLRVIVQVLSGDGGTIAALLDGNGGAKPSPGDELWTLDVPSGTWRRLHRDLDRLSGALRIADDGGTIGFSRNAAAPGGRREYLVVDGSGTSAPHVVTSQVPGELRGGVALSGDGSTLLVQTSPSEGAAEVWSVQVASSAATRVDDADMGERAEVAGAQSISDDGRRLVVRVEPEDGDGSIGRVELIDRGTGERRTISARAALFADPDVQLDDAGRYVMLSEVSRSDGDEEETHIFDLLDGAEAILPQRDGDGSDVYTRGFGISGDGRCVVFTTARPELLPGDVNERRDLVIAPNPLLPQRR